MGLAKVNDEQIKIKTASAKIMRLCVTWINGCIDYSHVDVLSKCIHVFSLGLFALASLKLVQNWWGVGMLFVSSPASLIRHDSRSPDPLLP
jgi:hypothetical protein